MYWRYSIAAISELAETHYVFEQTLVQIQTAMKKQPFTVILFLVVNLLQAQNPLVKQWDYRFGGTRNEVLTSFIQTSDGGFMLGGWSRSDISGDKTQNGWSNDTSDYWVVKLNSSGIKEWDKRFGGIDHDLSPTVYQTRDNGYILGGTSYSDSSGDKTQNNWGFNTSDYWVVKMDSLGNKQWDKRFGGTSAELFSSIEETSDGGYILGGSSESDISGDKTQNCWDPILFADDYWIIKIDSLGNKQWDKRFGGTWVDLLASIKQTTDKGYLLCGNSYSDIGGDKSQNNWGDTIFTQDYWIVKVDSLGNKQWDKRFGGTEEDELYSFSLNYDGGYILGGYSFSDISGDKTQASQGGSDYWIVKIDSLGIKQWDWRFGGTYHEDEMGSIFLTSDNSYLICGTSYSQIGGDKTENNLGAEQMWIVKIDSVGNKTWDKTILTNSHDESSFGVESVNGCYVFANYTSAGIGGEKTQTNWDVTLNWADYWLIKFCDSTIASGLNDAIINSNVLVYPNPFYSQISIVIQKQNLKQATFVIKNVLGQTIFSKQENNLSSNYTKTIDLSFLSKGIYLLDVISGGERTVKKIVKE